jgi:hypothetical protein
MTIRRFDMVYVEDIRESPLGEWVRHVDHEAELRSALDPLLSHVADVIEHLDSDDNDDYIPKPMLEGLRSAYRKWRPART